MSNVSGSFPQDESFAQNRDSMTQSKLQAGLAALKRQAYTEAIDSLETVNQLATDVSTLIKAQMGLVKAYAATGQTQKAIELCRALQCHPNPQVQTWVAQTLEKLAPGLSSDLSSGLSSGSSSDETGFVPLSQQDTTGFTPLVPASASREVVRPGSQHRSTSALPDPEQEDLAASLTQELTQDPETAIESRHASALPFEPTSRGKSSRSNADLDSSTTISTQNQPETDSTALAGTPSASPSASNPSEAIESGVWQGRQAERAAKWTSLGKVDPSPLWALEAGTVVALIWLIHLLMQGIQIILNRVFLFLNWLRLLPFLGWNGMPIWLIAIGVGLVFAASPWLLHQVLRRVYLLKPLPIEQLEAYSPEALRLLRRVCNQRRQPIPRLETLPTATPVIFSYGYLPRQAHLVISQGLLAQLADDEIAALCAAELGHIAYRDFGILSGITLLAQLPYLLYWHIAAWGDRQHDRVLQSIAVFFSCLSYGIYRLCRVAGVWLSRVRLYYSDRVATELTGNPNGLTRALLKLSIATADVIQEQGYTNPLLESFDLLVPVGYHQALTLGSIFTTQARSTLLDWEYRHPYRHALAFAQSHPPLGERLNLLNRYARHWRLPFELDWATSREAERSSSRTRESNNRNTATLSVRKLLQQVAPIAGTIIGLVLALLLSVLGWVADRAGWLLLDWFWSDRDAILQGCILLGFGIGMLLKINPAFPDIRRAAVQTNPALPDLLTQPTAMPIDSLPIRIQGTLLGRRGFANRFYQDLLLQTATGLIRLQYTSRLGFLGNVFSQSRRPTDLLKLTGARSTDAVTVTGWFRRGATPWLEAETIQPQRGAAFTNGHPIWATILAVGSILLGIYAILRGGL